MASDSMARPWFTIPESDLSIDRESLLGKGGFGCVYTATYRAAKVVCKEFTAGEASVRHAAAFKEAHILSLMHHNRIVRIEGVVEDAARNVKYLVMERGDQTLAEFVQTGVDRQTLQYIMRDVLSALSYLHRHSIMHRDIKPQNILVFKKPNMRPKFKVADLGISKLFISASENTTGSGSGPYRPPEVAKSDYTLAVDMFSFAATIAAVVMSCFEEREPVSCDEVWTKYVIEALTISVAARRVIDDAVKKLERSGCLNLADALRLCGRENPTERCTPEAALAVIGQSDRRTASSASSAVDPSLSQPHAPVAGASLEAAEKVRLSLSGSASGFPSPELLKEEADNLRKAAKFEEAIRKYNELLKKIADPYSHFAITVYNHRAACHQELLNFSAVVKDTTHVLMHDPKNAKALLRRGLACEKLKEYPAALDDIRGLLAVDPDNDIGKRALHRINYAVDLELLKEAANNLFKAAKFEEAIRKYTELLKMIPDPYSNLAITVFNNRAACNQQLSNFSAVVEDTTCVLEHQPNNAKALLRRGLAREELKDYHAALDDIQRLLAVDRDNDKASRAQRRIQERLRPAPIPEPAPATTPAAAAASAPASRSATTSAAASRPEDLELLKDRFSRFRQFEMAMPREEDLRTLTTGMQALKIRVDCVDKVYELVRFAENGTAVFDPTNTVRTALNRIRKPVKVVSIVGQYRTGKSLFQNLLMGSIGGFDLGHDVEGKTRGIWLRLREEESHVLIALDSEGLGDALSRGSNRTREAKMMALLVMISSQLVINVKGALDENVLSNLSVVTRLTKHFADDRSAAETGKTQTQKAPSSLSMIFPRLLFLVRDFTLRLIIEGQSVSEQDYINQILKQAPIEPCEDEDDEHEKQLVSAAKQRNNVREALSKNFRTISLRVLPPPVTPLSADTLERLERDVTLLTPEFKTKASTAIEEIKASVGSVCARDQAGRSVTLSGVMYSAFVEECCKQLNSEKSQFHIPDLMEEMAKRVGNTLLEQAQSAYTTAMESKSATFPISVLEFQTLHQRERDAAWDRIKGQLPATHEARVTNTWQTFIEKAFDDFKVQNEDKSHEHCKATWTPLLAALEAKVDRREFTSMEALENDYRRAKNNFKESAKGPFVDKFCAETVDGWHSNAVKLVATQLKLKEQECAAAEAKARAEQQATQAEANRRELEQQRIQMENEARTARREREALQQAIALAEERAAQQRRENEIAMMSRFREEPSYAYSPPPPARPRREEVYEEYSSPRRSNPWNEFQKANKGRYTREEMSAAYHRSKRR